MEYYLTAVVMGLCLSLMATGIFISMKIFKIPDITTDGSYTLGAVITAILLPAGYHPFVTILMVMIGGALAGAITGFIHAKFKIDALLSGILTMTALYSVNLSLMGRSNIPLINISSIFQLFTKEQTAVSDLITVLCFVGIITVAIIYVLKTDFGIAMRATGNSISMSKSLGVNVNMMQITGLAIANALTALSGYLIAQYQGFSDINMGIGIVITGLGSVLIADAIISWLNITKLALQILLVILGSIIFRLVLAFTLSIGIDPTMLKLITALFVLVIVALPGLKFKRS